MREKVTKIAESQKLRFGLVGVFNTIVDFAVLNVMVGFFGLPVALSNIVSTTTAMLVSFGLNKATVFRDGGGTNSRQIVLFFAVTITGLWLVQTAVVTCMQYVLHTFASMPGAASLNMAKVVGTCFSLVWNYLWYSRVVFRKGDHGESQ